METGLLVLLALTLGAGTCGAWIVAWSVHRRTRKLEYAVNDIEERLLTVRNREKSNKRWDREASIEQELLSLTQAQPARQSTRRFANDVIEPEL